MNNRITRREVAKQFIIAIELLLEWTEQKQSSSDNSTIEDTVENGLDTNLLKAPDVARILNISKGAAYRLIQVGQILSVRINSSIRVKPEDLDEFISQNWG
ncbi:MAG: helix-turn-helix domain-containing protein [Anaerolineales bacterium]